MQDEEEKATVLRALGWKLVQAGNFMAHVGPLWALREGEGWAYGLLATARHLNPGGFVHGGLLQTLADHAVSTVAWEAAGRRPCVTVQLGTHFLAAVREGAWVEARAQVVRQTAQLLFMHGGLVVAEHPVMAVQAVMKKTGERA